MVGTKVVEVVCLEEHVGEFGVTDACFAVFESGTDGFFGQHLVDAEKFAHIAEEVEEREG